MKVTKQEGKGALTIADVNGDTDSNLAPKENLKKLIETYKVSNPAKYELKREALEAQLKSL